MAQKIKAMTFNLRIAVKGDGINYFDYRLPRIIEFLDTEKPDVIGFQEVDGHMKELLVSSVSGYTFVGCGRNSDYTGESAVLAFRTGKFELLELENFWLSATPDTPSKGWDGQCFRTCTWAIFKCKDTGKQFAFFNTHLDHRGKEAQKEGLKTIVEKIKEIVPENIPVFLSGDFNTRTDLPIYEPLKAIMTDSRELAAETDHRGTYTGWRVRENPVVVDHIFVRGAEVDKFIVLCDKNYGAPYISDHYPVLTVARF